MKKLSLFFAIFFYALFSFASEEYSVQKVFIENEASEETGHIHGGYSKITKDEVSNKTNNDLSDFLFSEPNIEMQGGPRSTGASPVIRGLDASRILILDEGVRQNFQVGHAGKVASDFSFVETVEVVKGPWSSLYGSSALGGVISYRKTEASDLIRRNPNAKYGGDISLDYYSADTTFAQTVKSYLNYDKVKPLIAVRQSDNGDVRLGDGSELDYSGSQYYEVYSSIEWDISKNLKATFKPAYHDKSSRAPLNPQAEENPFVNPVAESKYIKTDLVTEFIYSRENFKWVSKPYFRSTTIENTRVSDNRYDKREVATYGFDTWASSSYSIMKYTVGAEFFSDSNEGQRNGAPSEAFPNGDAIYYGLYFQPSLFLTEKLELTMGLRFDSFTTEDQNQAFKKNKGEKLTAKSYLSYLFKEDSKVFMGWGQAFSAPKLQDLYPSGLHFPGNFFEANPNLEAESANQYELGFQYAKKIFSNHRTGIKVTAFHYDISDYIFMYVDFMGGTTRFINLDQVKSNGFEVSTFYSFEKIKSTLSYGQTRYQANSDLSPYNPQDRFSLEFSYIPSVKYEFGTAANLALRQDREEAVAGGESPSYYTQNVFFNYKYKDYALNMSVWNIFDRSFTPHGEAIQRPGRDIRVSLSYVF